MRGLCRICESLQHRNGKIYFSSTAHRLSGTPGMGTGKQARLEVNLDATAETYLQDKSLKPKYHPGVYHLTRQTLPPKFIQAAQRILAHENITPILEQTEKLRNVLWSRLLPMEKQEFAQKAVQIDTQINSKEDILRPFMSQAQLQKLDTARENKIKKRLRVEFNHWKQIHYERPQALQYLLTRSAGEYAALVQIFTEMAKRDPKFSPSSLCDYGSGIGTVIWACRSIWPKKLKEVVCADVSKEMNELAELLLRGANHNNDHGFPGLYFRQFLAESSKINYDLVVSAYSLFELPSLKSRLKMIDILWKKTSNYLVIVEQGTNAGFRAIIEARDYILELDRGGSAVADAHVFSPCPHSAPCPRFSLDDTPCNFYVKYKTLYPFHLDVTQTEKFCYIVLKKGPRNENAEQWPRLVYDPMVRHNHTICRLCTKEGKLSEVVITKNKHSRLLYRITRKSSCGDLLPVKELEDTEVDASQIEEIKSQEQETSNNLSDSENSSESDTEKDETVDKTPLK